MAYHGSGVWSLVAMQIIYGVVFILVLWMVTKWTPSLCFSVKSLRELFGFGGYILFANILQETCKNLQGIIIGRKFSANQMGYFSQAYKLDQITSYSIPQVIVQVMYPVYSSLQDDRERLNEIVAMNMRVIAFLIFPVIGLLILIAEPLIVFLYGEKWLPSVPYFQVLCVGGFFVCLQNVNFYAVAAVGKSKQLFYWSFYKWGFLLCALIIGMNFGMYGILWGMVLSNFNIFMVNSLLASNFNGLTVISQLKCIMFSLLMTIVSVIVAYVIWFISKIWLISIIIYFAFYFVIGFIIRYKPLFESMELLTRLIHRF